MTSAIGTTDGRALQRTVRRVRDSIGLATVILALALPLIPVAVWSISASWFFPDVVPRTWSLRSWNYLFTPDAKVIPAFVTSLTIAVTVALIAGVIGLSAGRALGLHSFRGKRLVYFLILAPEIVPPLTDSPTRSSA
jgi:putative spermidine/putrescine transport system permease protein